MLEVRDLWPDFAVALGVIKEGWVAALLRKIERAAYRTAELVIVNSPGYVAHVSKNGARRTVVLPNGACSKFFAANKEVSRKAEAYRKEWEAGERTVLLYAGALRRANKLDHVVAIAAAVNPNRFLFVVVGDGAERQRLMRKAEAASIRNILFLGSVRKADMPAILAAADWGVCCLATIGLFKLPYPNKVFDYMAAGKPTLCLIDGEIRKVIEHSCGGIYSDPRDLVGTIKILQATVSSAFITRKMGSNARGYLIKHFDRAIQIRELQKYFREFICVDDKKKLTK